MGKIKIVLATSNQGKVREIKKILDIKGIKILSLADFSERIRITENGRTFKENAVKKARAAQKKFGLAAIADDSGLCVDALHKKPGVRSARFARPPVTSEKLCKKLLRVMKDIPDKKRTAFFVCAVAVAGPGGRIKIIEGKVKGTIIRQLKGTRGFGYDSVFVPRGYEKTFARMPIAQKNKISHRGIAFRRTREYLSSILREK